MRVRLVVAPFVVFEVAVERGNYPPGYEPWAWAVAGAFVVGAALLFALGRRELAGRARSSLGALALVFDLAVVSAYVLIYSFEPSSPVRQLLFLPVVEAALRYGARGGVLVPFASAPALAFFESRASERLDVPFDPGHVIFPIGLQILVGIVVGALVDLLRDRATSRGS